MTDQPATRLLGMRLTFVLIVCIILFFQLLPLDTTPRRWVGPDMLMCFACAWALRRPEFVPALVLAFCFLMADFLLFRPPGLWAALAVLACEHLKSRAAGLRDSSFAAEWLAVSIVIAAVALAYRAAMMITLVDLPGFGLTIFELIMTVLFYPVAVAITHFLLGVQKVAPGDREIGGGPA